MIWNLKKRNRNEKGMAAVEFALVLPVALLLVAAIIELGTGFYRQQILTGAVREASRMGTLASEPRLTQGEIADKVFVYLDNAGLDGGTSAVTVTGAGGASGQPLTIEATYPTSTGFIAGMLSAVNTVYGTNGSGGTGSSSITGTLTLQARISAELE
ncbi:MAG: Flp pilus assembly protein TadG [Hyphomicrobiaceae bacterium]|jgi:Flp pilus assembly protein TadG